MIKIILIFIGVFTFAFNTKAQNGIENILFADISDANKLTTEYIRPASEGFIFGMSNGWYHTAKVHKSLGFDIAFGVNFSTVPSSKKSFNVNALNLSSRITKNPATSPTILGNGSAATNAFEVTIPANSDSNINGGIHPELKRTFTMPDGFAKDLPLSGIPTPVIQASLGLPSQFEVSLRFVPKVGSDQTKFNLFGLGLKKEITDWFGPIGKTPLHVSLMGAFTNMKVASTIEDPSGNEINITNGLAELKLNSYTFQALASLNFPIINVYGGFGYVGGSSSLNVTGKYELTYSNGFSTFNKVLNNPLSLNYNVGGLTTTLGARLSLGFFKLFGSYTLQEYSTFSAGMSFGLR